MTSIENILGTLAGALGTVLGVGVGSLASLTETISGISPGETADAG